MSHVQCFYDFLPARTFMHMHEFIGQPLRQETHGRVCCANLDMKGSNSISLCACVWTPLMHIHTEALYLLQSLADKDVYINPSIAYKYQFLKKFHSM